MCKLYIYICVCMRRDFISPSSLKSEIGLVQLSDSPTKDTARQTVNNSHTGSGKAINLQEMSVGSNSGIARRLLQSQSQSQTQAPSSSSLTSAPSSRTNTANIMAILHKIKDEDFDE